MRVALPGRQRVQVHDEPGEQRGPGEDVRAVPHDERGGVPRRGEQPQQPRPHLLPRRLPPRVPHAERPDEVVQVGPRRLHPAA
ncbi:hypothetical protein D5H75_36255 [Bailinhaonella thermotolerans]|uniref:Uncharacterized protein n=1 Tax=Bailinhaonella thermotolerans TaxID=1070861 RepID=A0A3A4ARH3_9ACTN|nr:hypothetical protein [Bailinhaonella thermotolerans]RJL22055.1 hypothetical protein D5H75_36255 [Bailinhaonella thermotolerans]